MFVPFWQSVIVWICLQYVLFSSIWRINCLFVCHVRALCSNGRRYRHDLSCIRRLVSVPDRVKIWITLVDSFLPEFCQKWPRWFDIRRRIAAEWSETVQWSRWRAYRKPPSLFRMVSKLSPTTSSSPKWEFQMHPKNQLRDACCHMMEYIDKRQAMSPFAKLLWPLFYITVHN